MDIFNQNPRLQFMALAAMEWAVYLRSNMEEPIAPFMFLRKGDMQYTRILMTDQNPLEYAKKTLESETEDYDLIAIGVEGILRNEQNEQFDTIIVHTFDVTQEQGPVLGQMFLPKEKNGTFQRIDRLTYLGPADLIVPLKAEKPASYAIEQVGFKGMSVEKEGRLVYLAFLTHDNPAVLADTIQKFIYSSLTQNNMGLANGLVEFEITPGKHGNVDFLAFVLQSVINDTKKLDFVKEWEAKTGTSLRINCRYQNRMLVQEFGGAAAPQELENQPTTPENLPMQDFSASTDSILEEPKTEAKKPWWKLW